MELCGQWSLSIELGAYLQVKNIIINCFLSSIIVHRYPGTAALSISKFNYSFAKMVVALNTISWNIISFAYVNKLIVNWMSASWQLHAATYSHDFKEFKEASILVIGGIWQ